MLVATSKSAQPAAARVGAYGLGNSDDAETPDDAPLSVTQATVRVRTGLADGDSGAPDAAAAAGGGVEEVLVDARYACACARFRLKPPAAPLSPPRRTREHPGRASRAPLLSPYTRAAATTAVLHTAASWWRDDSGTTTTRRIVTTTTR